MHVDLDIVYGEGEENLTMGEEIVELTKHLDLHFEVITEVGPAGGWPVVRFTSDDPEQLNTLLFRYFDGELDYEIMSMIESD